jgi:hypothetical protein
MERSSVARLDDPDRTLLIDQGSVGVHAVSDKSSQQWRDEITMAAGQPIHFVEGE